MSRISSILDQKESLITTKIHYILEMMVHQTKNHKILMNIFPEKKREKKRG